MKFKSNAILKKIDLNNEMKEQTRTNMYGNYLILSYVKILKTVLNAVF